MKAIITDLDRTLLHTDKSISDYTADVLLRCKQKGILLIVATARPQRDLPLFEKHIRFDAAIVTNGAIVVLPDKTITNCIPCSDAAEILETLCEIPNSVISMENADGFFANTDIPIWKPMIFDGFPALPTNGEIYKILAGNEHTDILPHAQSALTNNTYLTVANGHLIQIMSKSATKWNGIQTVLKYFNLDATEAVYFGDDYDDIEPIQNCGLGIAVSNAIDPVKQVANTVIGDNDSDSVAKYIETYLL